MFLASRICTEPCLTGPVLPTRHQWRQSQYVLRVPHLNKALCYWACLYQNTTGGGGHSMFSDSRICTRPSFTGSVLLTHHQWRWSQYVLKSSVFAHSPVLLGLSYQNTTGEGGHSMFSECRICTWPCLTRPVLPTCHWWKHLSRFALTYSN